MRLRRRSQSTCKPAYRMAADQRPSPSFALVVSLVVHALLVFTLYRAYSELIEPPVPAIQITASEKKPRPPVQPSFTTSPLPGLETADETPRPVAQQPSLPRPVTPIADIALRSAHGPAPIARKITANALLPVTAVELPAIVAGEPDVAVNSESVLPPAIASLARVDTLRDVPVRMAMLPDDSGTIPRKPALAILPAPKANERTSRPAAAFAHRLLKAQLPRENQMAINRGLEFLARVQLDDGRWRFDDLRGCVDPDEEGVNLRSDAAATGLAMLAFLGAGHSQFEGPYRWTTEDAIKSLVLMQQDSGEIFIDSGVPSGQVTRYYSHGIATLALCEAYGMTGDPRLRKPAQLAIEHLVATQHPEMGGWRYSPGVNTDLSVTGWQLAALRSGELAGLSVRRETIARIADCLAMCREHEIRPGLYRYNPWASPSDPLTRHGRSPSTVMTAVGLVMELQLGAAASDERLQVGGEHLAANLPQLGRVANAAVTGTLDNPERDTYYWYYATQAMFYLGGDYWANWSQQLEPLLIESQVLGGPLTGSWDPIHPTPDKWSAYGGRLYVTAMNLLSLEIYNRHLRFDAASGPQIAERPEEPLH